MDYGSNANWTSNAVVNCLLVLSVGAEQVVQSWFEQPFSLKTAARCDRESSESEPNQEAVAE